MTVELSWSDISYRADLILPHAKSKIFGVPRGGTILVSWLASIWPDRVEQTWELRFADTILDDIANTGHTLQHYFNSNKHKIRSNRIISLFRQTEFNGEWVSFPWERHPVAGIKNSESHDAVVRLLQYIGEDPKRDGLRDTPERVCRYLREMTCGYKQDPAAILSKTFEIAHNQMIILRSIEFTSLCEHHMLPFYGTVTIAYIPQQPTDSKNCAKVVGISKLARLVECFARRLQTQERMTDQIAHAILKHLDPVPLGVGVLVKAVHGCMACRGVNKRAVLITSALHGAMLKDAGVRAEFMALARED